MASGARASGAVLSAPMMGRGSVDSYGSSVRRDRTVGPKPVLAILRFHIPNIMRSVIIWAPMYRFSYQCAGKPEAPAFASSWIFLKLGAQKTT